METNGFETSASIGAIGAAMAKAQAQIKGAQKDRINPHFKSSYADLASVWDACREALTTQNIAVFQGASANGQAVTITTLLTHSSGEWVRSSLTVTAAQNTPQAVGSAITYGRRYGLSSMVGVAPDDDDGNAASSGPPEPRTEQVKRAVVSAAQLAEAAEARQNIDDAAEALGGTVARDVWVVPRGKSAGTPVDRLSTEDLTYWYRVLASSIADPAKARFKDKDERALKQVREAMKAKGIIFGSDIANGSAQ